MTGWVLILFLYARQGSASSLPDRPIVAATTAVFATEAACNRAGEDALSHFPGRVSWLCEAQAAK